MGMSITGVPGKPFDKEVYFHDTTIRDGIQSLWALWQGFGMFEAVCPLIEEGGLASVECAKFTKEMTWGLMPQLMKTCQMKPEKLINYRADIFQKTPILVTGTGMIIAGFGEPVSQSLYRYHCENVQQQWKGKVKYALMMALTRDEIQDEFPVSFPAWRAVGVEPIPYITYNVSPRHSDELYAKAVKECYEKFKPKYIVIKDVGGLITPERMRTLAPTFINNALGTPIECHLHGMSGFHEAVAVEAMKAGIRRFTTCIPPLANGSSHVNIFNVALNARTLGLKPQINEEPLRIASERLMTIAQEEFLPNTTDQHLPVGTVSLYDERVYRHNVPGGVLSTLISQLHQQKMADRLDEVLEETARIVVELGYPIMITPHSQFIVTQAVLNVATGERWTDYIDAMVAYAVGVYGQVDCGPKYMDQNLRDKLLSDPKAKGIRERWEKKKEDDRKPETFAQLKVRYGLSANATDDEFWSKYFGLTPEKIKEYREWEATPDKKYCFKR